MGKEIKRLSKELEEQLKGFRSVLGLHAGTSIFFQKVCTNCPFKKGAKSLGEQEGSRLLSFVRNGDEMIRYCDNKKPNYEHPSLPPNFWPYEIDINGEEHLIPKEPCVGYFGFMKKIGKLPRNSFLSDIRSGVSKASLEEIMDYKEFLETHKIEKVVHFFQVEQKRTILAHYGYTRNKNGDEVLIHFPEKEEIELDNIQFEIDLKKEE